MNETAISDHIDPDAEPEFHDEPDDDCKVAVEPHSLSEVASGNAPRAFASRFDPSAPVALSAPPPENLSGVPNLTDGSNAEALASGSSHTEAGMTGGTADTDEFGGSAEGEEPEDIK